MMTAKQLLRFRVLSVALVAAFMTTSCATDSNPAAPLPQTSTASNTSATLKYVLVGTVTDAAGKPIANATIAVADAAPNPNAGKSVTSDGSGNYRLTGLTYTTVGLAVTATGYGKATGAVPLAIDNDTTAADYVLTPSVSTYTISGIVRSE